MNTPEMTITAAQERLAALRREARAERAAARPRFSWRFEFPGVVLTVTMRPLRQTA